MMKNFDYLKDIKGLKDLYLFCQAAENTQKTDPDNCAINARRALEWIVRAVYTLKHIHVDGKDQLFELMTSSPFTEFISDDKLMMAAHYVRKIGNKSAHKGGVKMRESFFTLLDLYNLVGGILLKLKVIPSLAVFDKSLVPTKPEVFVAAPSMAAAPDRNTLYGISEEAVQHPEAVEIQSPITEAETRKHFIDLMLEEAGWEVLSVEGAMMPSKAGIEIEVEGMPNSQRKGFVDYVLFGSNGKPLAVVEAKRTSKDPVAGKHQAELYADCLEQKYGVKPVIYYTNGYRTFCIDRLGYPEREVLGYHTEADLEVLQMRQNRAMITDLRINDHITDREYQKRAIRAVCEHLNGYHRKGLLVMATGTGKTRVSISMVDVLMRNNWVKNVLFLADRTALVNQASKNFSKLLPHVTTSKLSENKAPDKNARILFSTYQTMINYIDRDEKEFSIGRFDLIIIDEAHRSVYGKYTVIFDYFDSLLVGLTATPRDEVDRSTYDLFELDSGQPNFAYELEEAVSDGYLVDYNPISRTTNILKNGIKYASLSESEKKQMDAVWKYEAAQNIVDFDEGLQSRNIDSKEIFKYIYNLDTIDKVLTDVMEHGLKVQGGDVIGKTIIFAYNHKHANLIVERFTALYPELGSDFCVLIDNYVNYALDLINKFEVRNKRPQIAVSVDMLDTGIDVPDILNLVFFKPVHSQIKFWQMIGRGTRLSKNVFDAGQDKKEFYIFDWCGNFEYFGKNPKGKEAAPQISLTERLYGFRVDLACVLQHEKYQSDAFAKSLHDELKQILYEKVMGLNILHISVRKHLSVVDKYKNKEKWEYISTVEAQELKDVVVPLFTADDSNEGAKKFDVLMLHIQLSLVDPSVNADFSKDKVVQIAEKLQEKASIVKVKSKMPLLKEIVSQQFWEGITLNRLEHVRREVRDLVQFILGTSNRTFTINVQDIVQLAYAPMPVKPRMTYKQKVMDFLAENKNLEVIRKIQNIEQLTRDDILTLERILWRELGTKEDYEKYVHSGNMLCGDHVAVFIRAQVGVDKDVALRKFSEYLSDHVLNSLQEEYLKTIITYVCNNGDITAETLVNESPFDEYDLIEIFGEQLQHVAKYIEVLHQSVVA